MARNQEKANLMFNKWSNMKDDLKRGNECVGSDAHIIRTRLTAEAAMRRSLSLPPIMLSLPLYPAPPLPLFAGAALSSHLSAPTSRRQKNGAARLFTR